MVSLGPKRAKIYNTMKTSNNSTTNNTKKANSHEQQRTISSRRRPIQRRSRSGQTVNCLFFLHILYSFYMLYILFFCFCYICLYIFFIYFICFNRASIDETHRLHYVRPKSVAWGVNSCQSNANKYDFVCKDEKTHGGWLTRRTACPYPMDFLFIKCIKILGKALNNTHNQNTWDARHAAGNPSAAGSSRNTEQKQNAHLYNNIYKTVNWLLSILLMYS